MASTFLATLRAIVAARAAEYPAAKLAVDDTASGAGVAYVDAVACDAGHVALAAVRADALAKGYGVNRVRTKIGVATLRVTERAS